MDEEMKKIIEDYEAEKARRSQEKAEWWDKFLTYTVFTVGMLLMLISIAAAFILAVKYWGLLWAIAVFGGFGGIYLLAFWTEIDKQR